LLLFDWGAGVRALWAKIGDQLLAAIAGGVVTVLLLVSGWIWTDLFERAKIEIADIVMKQLDYFPQESPEKIQHIDFSCPPGSRIATASCIEHDSANYLQTAITTFNKDGSMSCDRYGNDAQAKVKATAICFKVRNKFQ
jgi:hypothetical protein